MATTHKERITNYRTLVPKSHYTASEIFEIEQRSIFQKTWQLFCLDVDLREPDDFISRDVGGEPVVMQNVGGTCNAFHNICSHRFSPVQIAECGNRPLRCPYHGWQYNATGYPAAIPHNLAFYPVSKEEKKCLGLSTFEHSKCGNLQFVRVAPGGQSLGNYLGETFPLYEEISESFGDVYLKSTITAKCNWKFLVHNLFDDIHAEFVHPSSSLDTSSFCGNRWNYHPFDSEREDPMEDCSRRHAQFYVDIKPEAAQKNENRWARWFPDRKWKNNTYFHSYIFPNVALTSFMGYWFNIVQYRPVAPDITEIGYWLIPARQTEGAERINPNMLHSLALGALRIFNEDILAVETSQAKIHSLKRPGILGQRENKIMEFEKAYMHIIGKELP